MTKELKQEAKDFVNTSSTIYKRVIGWNNYQRGAYIGYLASAKPREKRIAELEAQIEKMECCENCVFLKEKTYDICHRIKKLGTRKCAFYKMM